MSSVIDAAEEIKYFLIQDKLQFTIVMKVIGPVHKTEAGGVILSIANEQQAAKTFDKLMSIPEAKAVLM